MNRTVAFLLLAFALCVPNKCEAQKQFAGFKVNFEPDQVMVQGIDLSLDGNLLVTGGDKVRVFHVSSRRLVQEIRTSPLPRQMDAGTMPFSQWAALITNNRWTRKVAFSPAVRNVFATAGDDGVVRLWQVSEPKPFLVLPGHKGRVTELAFSPDGRLLATGDSRSKRENTLDEVRIWDVTTGECIKSDNFYNDGADSIVFYDNETLVFSCSDRKNSTDSVIEFRDLKSWAVKKRIPFGPGWSIGVAFTPDRDKMIITGGECIPLGPNSCRPTGYLWIASLGDNPTVKQIKTARHGYFSFPMIEETGDHFLTTTNIVQGPRVSDILERRRVSDGALVLSIERGVSSMFGFRKTADGNRILCCGQKEVACLNAKTGEQEWSIEVSN